MRKMQTPVVPKQYQADNGTPAEPACEKGPLSQAVHWSYMDPNCWNCRAEVQGDRQPNNDKQNPRNGD